ncbi:putative Ribosomal protein L13 [Trypanosoma vivax]|uniref:Putative ribosomal protein L13 n=1 Tax=Trypanosoma vivax (strain Y486) TaxID=1055687 RepID=G0TTY1_TRYVY|nr:50S ribosomal protein L13 [Trypanosoma vivax]KAH8613855.1 putative Ribosomal protein L13 [Trypanosoma vivax]CCC47414.1 putative ribosomal protein L13 [Trypanosoma vivax Y486]
MQRPTRITIAPFKSVLRRHKYHPEGLPLYNDMSKQWLCREGERWWLLDARGEQLPRVAAVAAQYITGQHRPDFTPGMIVGDHVVIINIRDVVMVGDQWIRVPITWQTAYPGGKYRIRLTDMYERDPCMLMWWFLKDEVNRHFVRKLKTRVAPLEKAWLYEDSVHPHADKNPRPLCWSDPEVKGWKYTDPQFVRRWRPNEFIH